MVQTSSAHSHHFLSKCSRVLGPKSKHYCQFRTCQGLKSSRGLVHSSTPSLGLGYSTLTSYHSVSVCNTTKDEAFTPFPSWPFSYQMVPVVRNLASWDFLSLALVLLRGNSSPFSRAVLQITRRAGPSKFFLPQSQHPGSSSSSSSPHLLICAVF